MPRTRSTNRWPIVDRDRSLNISERRTKKWTSTRVKRGMDIKTRAEWCITTRVEVPSDLIRPLVGWHHSTFSRMSHDKRVEHSTSLSFCLSILVPVSFPRPGMFAEVIRTGRRAIDHFRSLRRITFFNRVSLNALKGWKSEIYIYIYSREKFSRVFFLANEN